MSIHFKALINYNDVKENRRFALESCDFDALLSQCDLIERSVSGAAFASECLCDDRAPKITYVDGDGDTVRIGSDEELDLYVREQQMPDNRRLVRIRVDFHKCSDNIKVFDEVDGDVNVGTNVAERPSKWRGSPPSQQNSRGGGHRRGRTPAFSTTNSAFDSDSRAFRGRRGRGRGRGRGRVGHGGSQVNSTPHHTAERGRNSHSITDTNVSDSSDSRPGRVKNAGRRIARCVEHIVPDGTAFRVGELFTKSWRVANDTDKQWPPIVSLVHVGRDKIGAPPVWQLSERIAPHGEGVISIDLKAPLIPGEYTGFWRLCDGEGKKFGQRLRCVINVHAPVQ